MSNPENQHTALFTSKQGAVTGCTVKGNHNIQRGGGYGFNPQGKPGYGVMPIESYSDCGTVKQPSLNTATQHAGSVPTARPGISKRQSGGGVAKNAGTLVNMKADATAGPCKNCGGTPYYGYSKAIPGVNNYPTFSAECHPMCGGPQAGGSRRRHRRRRRKKCGGRRRTRRGGNRRSRRGRRRTRQRGGYAQFGSDIPSTPGDSLRISIIRSSPAVFAWTRSCICLHIYKSARILSHATTTLPFRNSRTSCRYRSCVLSGCI